MARQIADRTIEIKAVAREAGYRAIVLSAVWTPPLEAPPPAELKALEVAMGAGKRWSLEELRSLGQVSADTRYRLAADSFSTVAAYHAEIAAYLNQISNNVYPQRLALVLRSLIEARGQSLRRHLRIGLRQRGEELFAAVRVGRATPAVRRERCHRRRVRRPDRGQSFAGARRDVVREGQADEQAQDRAADREREAGDERVGVL